MLTNHAGIFQRDRRLEPIYDVLNKRRSVVSLRPAAGCNPLEDHYPSPMMEFFFDTTRAVVNLMLPGTLSKYPNITWISAHAGGALPSTLLRFTGFSQLILGSYASMTEEEARTLLGFRF